MGNAQEINAPDISEPVVRDGLEDRVRALLERMTLEDKIGQLNQVEGSGADPVASLAEGIRAGQIGSIINQVDPEINAELQRIAVEESRLGIPLLVGRDVIHGFETVAPLPLGQAASWNPDIVRQCARLSALEASAAGVNWTFAPMVDICRDPRWGRIAESFGEDPFLTGVLGVAMVEGFHGDDLTAPDSLVACAKHFVGYGASESGRDYNTTNIPDNELRNVHLPPFRALLEAGTMTLMTSFSDLDGVPATANSNVLRDILRDEWGFDGFVVSDWDSIRQLVVHGLVEDDIEATHAAASAGVDMDMVGSVYLDHLIPLCEQGRIELSRIDEMTANVLRVKLRAGLLDGAVHLSKHLGEPDTADALRIVKEAALQSLVLLQNQGAVLPLDESELSSLAVIGPMADAPVEQMGTWVFDGDPGRSVTPLNALKTMLAGKVEISFTPAMETTRARDEGAFDGAVEAARAADVSLLVLGEEAILSGEAHCRADISLPGAQAELVRRVREVGKPVVAIIMTGRPLVLSGILDQVDGLIFAAHPGSMAGPAIADLLFGHAVPSGKLPVTLPKMVGQIPIYYGHKNTGRPATADSVVQIDDIEPGAAQTSLGMTAFHLDAGHEPLFPFGFGLSYTTFEYGDLALDRPSIAMGEALCVDVTVCNCGKVPGTEIVQLYIRDRVGSVTRPVRELKGFTRVALRPGEERRVRFELHTNELGFYRRDKSFGAEPGEFDVWVGGDSNATLHAGFRIES
jgi:beta-glucosidase